MMIRKEVFEKMLAEIYDQNDRLAFKQYLTLQEERQFVHEEELIEKQRSELYKKYNKIVSDRLSHKTLIKEIKNITKNSTHDLHELLISMENRCLQQLLSILRKVKE